MPKKIIHKQRDHLATAMAPNSELDEDAIFNYIHFQHGEDDGMEVLPDTPAMTTGSQPLLNISEVLDVTNQFQQEEDPQPEPLQHWLEPPTINPRELESTIPYPGQPIPSSTPNGDNYHPPPSSTFEQSNISVQPQRRLRRLEPAPARGSEGTSLETSPSCTNTSSSTSGPVTESSNQPTPQDNLQSDRSLICHCGSQAKTSASLK